MICNVHEDLMVLLVQRLQQLVSLIHELNGDTGSICLKAQQI